MHFKPKNYLDLCMAMKTKATVEIDGRVGIVIAIRAVALSNSFYVTISGKTEVDEIHFVDS